MTDKTFRKPIPELKRFVDKKGREYINLLAHKLMVSERTMLRWYKEDTRPAPAEKDKLLQIIKGYEAVGRKAR